MTNGGVYQITCKANNKRYYGRSAYVANRITGHQKDLDRGKHFCAEMQADYNHHKESFSFDIVKHTDEYKEMYEIETSLIREGRDTQLLYNKWRTKRQSEDSVSNLRVTAIFQPDILKWVNAVKEREGFSTITQTINWILYKAMEKSNKN